MYKTYRRSFGMLSSLAVLALAASACASTSDAASKTSAEPEETARSAALAVSYENGIAVLDGKSLEVRQSFDSEAFTRLNAAGDGRSVLVTTSKGFQVLDTKTPELRQATFAAKAPGHVVRHDGKTILFDDGTGDTTIFESSSLARSGNDLPQTNVVAGQEAHHGVSVKLSDGALVTTVGTAESRSGAKALDEQGNEIARSENCPGVHGEGTAAGEAVVFGCEDGALLYHDGHFDKFTAPDKYGRMGNAFVSESSPLIVGDYKNDPDDEGYLLEKVALIDTEKHSYKVLDLPGDLKYTWRGVVRGPQDRAYILATDGSIHVLDPASGKVTGQYPVIGPWEGPKNWQDAHPALTVNGDTAYVADPQNKQVHAVNLATGEKTASVTLDGVPNEMAAAIGR